MANDFSRFQEYLKKKESFECENKRYEAYWNKTLREILELFLEYRRVVEKRANSTVRVDKRRMHRLFEFLTPAKLNEITLAEFVDDVSYFQKQLDELKRFFLEETEYSRNYVSGLLAHVNPFFKRFLQLDVHISVPAKTSSSFERIRIKEIDQFVNHIDKTFAFKVKNTCSIEEQRVFRRRWAVERFIVLTMKYTWARSIEICNIELRDIKQMMETNTLHLRSHKREKNPKEYQHVVVPAEYVTESELYLRFRDSNDWSDISPAITRHGKPLKTRYIRYLMHKYDNDMVLPKDFTCHNIRRSMHTLARHVFINPKVAQLQLGDVSSKIADDHYNIPDVSLIQSELSRLYQSDHLPGEDLMPGELRKNVEWSDYSYV